MEELTNTTPLTRDLSPYLTDRYSGRKEAAAAQEARLNLKDAIR